MEDAFFDGDAGTSDWLKLIDEAVSEAMEQFDIDSLAPTGTPKDWVRSTGVRGRVFFLL